MRAATRPVRLSGLDGIRAHAHTELGVSSWHVVSQSDVDTFANLTRDHQWIHVDVERAGASSFGGTIAHGYLTLSLAPMMCAEIYEITEVGFGLNYGLNRVRFPAPMLVGSAVRLRARLDAVDDIDGHGIQMGLGLTFETDAGDKPVCVAESLIRVYAAPARG
jgi:acyl dehydratase